MIGISADCQDRFVIESKRAEFAIIGIAHYEN